MMAFKSLQKQAYKKQDTQEALKYQYMYMVTKQEKERNESPLAEPSVSNKDLRVLKRKLSFLAKPEFLVTRWADVSKRFGFIYEMSQVGLEQIGVNFNDGTKLMTHLHEADRNGTMVYSDDKFIQFNTSSDEGGVV